MTDDRQNPLFKLQRLATQQAKMLDARQAAIDSLGKSILEYEQQFSRLGSMLILAVRAAGGQVVVTEAEQEAIHPTTTVNTQHRDDLGDGRGPGWVLTVLEPMVVPEGVMPDGALDAQAGEKIVPIEP